MTPAFRQLMNRFYMVGHERQIVFDERLGHDREWTLSLEDGTVSFGPNRTWRIQLLGLYTPGEDEGIWRWSWADARSLPNQLLVAGRRIRQFGKKRNCPELLEEEYPPEPVHLDPRALALVGTGIAELPVFHSFPYRNGVLYAALDIPGFELPEAEPDRMASVIDESLNRYSLDDRTALETYMSARGAKVSGSAEGVTGRWEDGRAIHASLGLDRRYTGVRVIGRAARSTDETTLEQ